MADVLSGERWHCTVTHRDVEVQHASLHTVTFIEADGSVNWNNRGTFECTFVRAPAPAPDSEVTP